MQDKQKVYDQTVRDAFQEYNRESNILWKKYLWKVEAAKEVLFRGTG